jgi:hypothetical protein
LSSDHLSYSLTERGLLKLADHSPST